MQTLLYSQVPTHAAIGPLRMIGRTPQASCASDNQVHVAVALGSIRAKLVQLVAFQSLEFRPVLIT